MIFPPKKSSLGTATNNKITWKRVDQFISGDIMVFNTDKTEHKVHFKEGIFLV